MEKNNNKLVIFLLIIIICLLAVGGYLGYTLLSDKTNSDVNIGGTENKYTSYDYDINNIKNIVVEVPVANATDPEMKNVTITNKDEFSDILSNVTNLELVGKMPSVGFLTNVTITINYNGDPSTKIIILDNGNVAINFSVGAGESGYAEYKIANKNLATELKNKYQQLDENNRDEIKELIGKYVAVSSDLDEKEYFVLNSDGTVNIYRVTGDRGAYANITAKYSLVTEDGKKVLKFDLESQSWNILDAVKTSDGYKFVPREVGPSATDLIFEKEK